MNKNILIGLIIVLSSINVYAKGGGGSFGQSNNDVVKFPPSKSRTYIKSIGTINIEAKINIRYRNWFGIKDWRSGYAQIDIKDTSKLKKSKKVYLLDMLEYEMYQYNHWDGRTMDHFYLSGSYAGVVKKASKYNTSSLKLDLREVPGPVAVQFKIYGKNKQHGKSFFLENWWDQNSPSTGKFSIKEW